MLAVSSDPEMEMRFLPGSWFVPSTANGCSICSAVERDLEPESRLATAELARLLLISANVDDQLRAAVSVLSDAVQPSRASVVVPEVGGIWRVFASSDLEHSHDLVIASDRYPELLEVRRTGLPFVAPEVDLSPALADQRDVLLAAGIQGMAAFPIWMLPGQADPVILKLAARRTLAKADVHMAVAVAHLVVHRLAGAPREDLSRRLVPQSVLEVPERALFSIHHLPLSALIVDWDGRVRDANVRAGWLTPFLSRAGGDPPFLPLHPPRPWERGASRWEAAMGTGGEPTQLLGWSRQLPNGHVLVILEAHPEAKRRDRERQIQQTLALKVRELAEANRRLEEYAMLRSRFVSDAAHELKTPLAILRSYLETLETDLSGGLDPEQREFLRAATVGAQRLQSLVEALLDLAALEAGHSSLELRDVKVEPLLHEVVEELLPRARQAGVSLTVSPSRSVTLRADPNRLAQVLRNLVDNGIKYSRRGGRVTMSFQPKGESGLVVVEDTGIGVPPDVLPHIFEEFVRGTAPDSPGGAGLGLAIVRRLVQAMGGRVWAESKEHQGSRFSVELPLWTGDL